MSGCYVGVPLRHLFRRRKHACSSRRSAQTKMTSSPQQQHEHEVVRSLNETVDSRRTVAAADEHIYEEIGFDRRDSLFNTHLIHQFNRLIHQNSATDEPETTRDIGTQCDVLESDESDYVEYKPSSNDSSDSGYSRRQCNSLASYEDRRRRARRLMKHLRDSQTVTQFEVVL